MAAGVRSLLAFWAGGAASSPTQAGVKSPLAFWMGGAAASPVVSSAGVRSLLAFWAGGASSVSVTPAPPAVGGGGRMPRRITHAEALREQQLAEDELILLFVASAVRCGLI